MERTTPGDPAARKMKAEKLVPAVAETPFPPAKRDLTFYLVLLIAVATVCAVLRAPSER